VTALLSTLFPFFPWLRHYRLHHLRADLTAGLTVAVVAVPQSMAYAMIAGIPVQYGLYASIVPTITACLWGSSAHLITGPTTTVSLLVFTTLSAIAQEGPPFAIESVFLLAAIVGVIQIGMGLARLGVLLNFVSRSVVLGYSAGAAVLIGFKQIQSLLGLRPEKGDAFFEGLRRILTRLSEIQPVVLWLVLLTMALIVALQRWKRAWPGPLMAMTIAGLLVWGFDLRSHGVAVVGTIPRSLPPVFLPPIPQLDELIRLVPGALAIALLGLVEATSIAKTIAGRTHQRLDIDRAFIALGLGNLTAACSSGYPVSGSFTRSAVNFGSGGKTPMSGIVSGLAVALLVVLAAPLAASLPVAALAGVLLVVAFEMIRWEDIRRTVRATRSDAAVLALTFLSTLLLSIEFAVYVGVLLSIGLHLATTSHPHIYTTLPDLKSGKLKGSAFGRMCCQMDIVRIEGSVFFGSASFVLESLQRRLKSHPTMVSLLIRMHQVNNFDASGVFVFEQILEEVRIRGGGLYFSGVNTRVFQVFKNSGLLPKVGETRFRGSSGSAIRLAMRESFSPAVCATCPEAVFTECPELKRGNWGILDTGAVPRRNEVADAVTPAGGDR